MKLENYKSFLTEKKLSIPELNKDEARWDMFLSKLKNNSPFIYDNGTEVIVENPEEIIDSITDINGNLDMDKIKEYLRPKNRYSPVIKTNNGDVKLNQFHKTEEFGGGTGSSLGSVNARTYETTQAIFFSLRQYLGRDVEPGDIHLLYTETNEVQPENDINTSDDKSAILKDVHSTKEITRDDLKFFEDKGWIYTYIKTANELFRSLDNSKHYSFYHAYVGHSIADELYEAYKRAFKNINKDNKVRISMSRWNPSDLWVVETNYEKALIDILNQTEDIIELNAVMDKCFKENYLVGISLKKIPFGKNIELIISKTLHPNFRYDYTSVSENPLDTLTVQIHSTSMSELYLHKRNETLDTRIYSGKQEDNIFLEVKGSASKYGKASLNYINYILKKVKIEPIPTYKEIDLTDEQLRRIIRRFYQTIPNLKLKHSRSDKWYIGNTRSKLISKYQSLMLVDKLERYKKNPYKRSIFGRLKFLFNKNLNVTNHVIKEIFYYAYSMGGDLFDNTMFYRIRTHR